MRWGILHGILGTHHSYGAMQTHRTHTRDTHCVWNLSEDVQENKRSGPQIVYMVRANLLHTSRYTQTCLLFCIEQASLKLACEVCCEFACVHDLVSWAHTDAAQWANVHVQASSAFPPMPIGEQRRDFRLSRAVRCGAKAFPNLTFVSGPRAKECLKKETLPRGGRARRSAGRPQAEEELIEHVCMQHTRGAPLLGQKTRSLPKAML